MYIKKTMPGSNFRSFTSSALTSSEELRVKALPPHLGCRDPVPGFGWIFLLHPPKFLHSWSFLLNRPHFTPLSHLSEQSDPKSLYLTSQAEWHSLQQSSLSPEGECGNANQHWLRFNKTHSRILCWCKNILCRGHQGASPSAAPWGEKWKGPQTEQLACWVTVAMKNSSLAWAVC